MLKLTKKADYGLIAMRHLTAVRPQSASAKEIASNYRLPVPVLSKILQVLARAGFLASEHGTNGGYRLAREAREITVFDVVRAIDGPIFLTACFTDNGECEHHQSCSIRDPLRRVHEGIIELLNRMTMEELAADAEPARPAHPAVATVLGALPVLNRN